MSNSPIPYLINFLLKLSHREMLLPKLLGKKCNLHNWEVTARCPLMGPFYTNLLLHGYWTILWPKIVRPTYCKQPKIPKYSFSKFCFSKTSLISLVYIDYFKTISDYVKVINNDFKIIKVITLKLQLITLIL